MWTRDEWLTAEAESKNSGVMPSSTLPSSRCEKDVLVLLLVAVMPVGGEVPTLLMGDDESAPIPFEF